MIVNPCPVVGLSQIHDYPFYQNPAGCGFPSPAADYLEDTLSLDQLLVQHPSATFFARAQGDSMMGAGIHDGDLLIIDRAITAKSEDVIIALLDGELLVKRLHLNSGRVELHSENASYAPLILRDEQELDIWGVVTQVIHTLRP